MSALKFLRNHEALMLLCISLFFVNFCFGMFIPIIPYYVEHLGIALIWLGVIFAAMPATRAFIDPFSGSLSDKLGRKSFIFTSLLIYAIVFLLYGYAGPLLSVIFVRILQGAASAMLWVIAAAYIVDITETSELGVAMGIYNASIMIAWTVGQGVGGVILSVVGFQLFFVICFLISLAGAILCLLKLKEPKKTFKIKENRRLTHYQKRVIIILSIVQAIISFGTGVLLPYIPVFANQSFNATISEIGIIFMLQGVAIILFSPPFGKLSDKIGRKQPILFGLCFTAIVFFVITFSKDLIQLTILLVVGAIVSTVSSPAANALYGDVSPTSARGKVMGIRALALDIGTTLGAVLAGLIWTLYGAFYCFTFTALLTASAAVIFWIFLYLLNPKPDEAIR